MTSAVTDSFTAAFGGWRGTSEQQREAAFQRALRRFEADNDIGALVEAAITARVAPGQLPFGRAAGLIADKLADSALDSAGESMGDSTIKLLRPDAASQRGEVPITGAGNTLLLGGLEQLISGDHEPPPGLLVGMLDVFVSNHDRAEAAALTPLAQTFKGYVIDCLIPEADYRQWDDEGEDVTDEGQRDALYDALEAIYDAVIAEVRDSPVRALREEEAPLVELLAHGDRRARLTNIQHRKIEALLEGLERPGNQERRDALMALRPDHDEYWNSPDTDEDLPF